ncbi:hypothetical protein [Parasediminibacterium sp. JCM 36343]|uniref:hypothetical protein n=1 Tax=Parasediminibacterium sp. JCM 36343 TaxID=3374279 RepID=UPI0039798C12
MQEKINRRDHLLETVSNKYEGSTHMAKTEFRLTAPFLAKIFNIKTKWGIYILQLIAGFLFFGFLTVLLLLLTNDKGITFLFAMAFGFIYPGYSFVAEMEGFFDSFAFLFLLIAMLDINIMFIALAFFFAFWTDERAILASSLVLFWWQYQQNVKTKKSFFLPALQSFAFGFSLFIYLLLRWYLILHYGFKNQFAGAGLTVLGYTINYAGIVFWQAFEGFWLFLPIALYQLYCSKKYLIGIVFIMLNAALFLGALTVMGITRSMAYIFPSIIIAFYIAKESFEVTELKRLMAIVLLFCFVYPSYSFIVGKGPHPYNPIYMRATKKLLHID